MLGVSKLPGVQGNVPTVIPEHGGGRVGPSCGSVVLD
jgi:hypothetical protein